MNLTDRLYLAVHLALTLLVLARHQHIPRWPMYVVWNLAVIATLFFLARKQRDSVRWEFAHDWFPGVVLLTSVFEETASLSLALVPHWQSAHLIALESRIFGAQPAVWLQQHLPGWTIEFLDFGYFAFYPLYPAVAAVLWAWRGRPRYAGAFRRMTDAIACGYFLCYAIYILWPTQSPHHDLGITSPAHGGVFHWLVSLIQGNAGVHGNAFPSGHIMLAFAVLVFVWRYLPRFAPWLLIINLLMCLGAVYDGYHFASDVIAGALLGSVVGAFFLASPASNPAVALSFNTSQL